MKRYRIYGVVVLFGITVIMGFSGCEWLRPHSSQRDRKNAPFHTGIGMEGEGGTQKSSGPCFDEHTKEPAGNAVEGKAGAKFHVPTAGEREMGRAYFPAAREKGRPGSPQAGRVRVIASAGEGKKGKKIEGRGEKVSLNFDDADLMEVVRVIADLLKINFAVEPDVKGKVTLHTAGGIEKERLLPVFFQILELNGLTAIKENNLYRIVDLKEAPRLPIHTRLGHRAGRGAGGQRIIIQVIPLNYASSQEMTKVITPFVSEAGTVVSSERANTLLVADKEANLTKVLKLIEAFDVDLFGRRKHMFFKIRYTDVDSLAGLLEEVFRHPGEGGSDLKLIPIDRLNLLLALSSHANTLHQIEAFLEKLDVPSDEAELQIFVYSIKNGEAKELGTLLNTVFMSGRENGKTVRVRSGEKSQNPFLMGREQKLQKNGETQANPSPESAVSQERSTGEAIASGTLRGDVRITPDEVRNALIIEATPRDYRIVKGILRRIDVLPRQVLIEVTVAEITLDESTELGMEWSYIKGPKSSTSLLSGTIGSSGLRYVIGQADRWSNALTALASENKVNIISSPSVLASDNKTAKIDISTEIPVVSAQYQTQGTIDPILETNIQYRNTGVILSVTPHINERGLVSLDISQEVSEQSTGVQVGEDLLPSFFKRTVQTTLTVKHQQTIVIGGLIKETKQNGVSGVPCLIRVPFLKWGFGTEKMSVDKTEMIVLITPHVITSLDDVETVTTEFREKLGSALKDTSAQRRMMPFDLH